MARETETLVAVREVRAEIVEVRRRVDRLIWGTGIGFVAVAAIWAMFRYVG